MKLVVDAIGVRRGSAAIVTGHLLQGWAHAAPADAVTILVDGPPHFRVPPGMAVEQLTGRPGLASRLWAQSIGVRRACRAAGADAVLSAVTVGSLLGAPCPTGAIVYDVRHELRPDQFSYARRVARRALYGWTFRRADALFCISERTRRDLLAPRPGLARKAHTTLLGADHAAGWRPAGDPPARYVLAFGHFPNKNVDAVLQSWARFGDAPPATLRVCGLADSTRAAAHRTVEDLGLGHTVELVGWLEDAAFQQVFAGAAAIVFPSDFEGFGLPVVEALLLGIPVVISSDPALAEVSGGHAVVAIDDAPQTLATAVSEALSSSPEKIAAGVRHARSFTWARMAGQIRELLG